MGVTSLLPIDVERIRTDSVENAVADIKELLYDLMRDMQRNQYRVKESVTVVESTLVNITETNAFGLQEWRVKPVGNHLQVQKKVSGVWTKAFLIRGA